MDRNYGTEIDELRKQLVEIKMLISDLKATSSEVAEPKANANDNVKAVESIHPDTNIVKLMEDCEKKCNEENLSGCMTYLGVFSYGNTQTNWAEKDKSTDEFLNLASNRAAESIMLTIGSRERLKIITALLKKPMTVAEMTEELHFETTGKTYHHLKPLIYDGIVVEVQKSCYSIVPCKYRGILMILAGVNDLIGGYDYK